TAPWHPPGAAGLRHSRNSPPLSSTRHRRVTGLSPAAPSAPATWTEIPMRKTAHRFLLGAGAGALALASHPALAADEAAEDQARGSIAREETEAPKTSQEIVVQANIGFRNRTDQPEPVLVYDE